jgi:hypothetical protein
MSIRLESAHMFPPWNANCTWMLVVPISSTSLMHGDSPGALHHHPRSLSNAYTAFVLQVSKKCAFFENEIMLLQSLWFILLISNNDFFRPRRRSHVNSVIWIILVPRRGEGWKLELLALFMELLFRIWLSTWWDCVCKGRVQRTPYPHNPWHAFDAEFSHELASDQR